MTLLDTPIAAPRLVCGIRRASWGTHETLGCILDMNHEGRIHQDRLGRTWELMVEYTPRQHHLDVVGRLVALQASTLALLDRVAGEIHDPDHILDLQALARAERKRYDDTLVSMGLAEHDEPLQAQAVSSEITLPEQARCA